MKRLLLGLVVLVGLGGAPTVAQAHYAYDDSQSHPLRVVAYAVYPVGYLLEWLIFRPMHFVISQPKIERMVGHTPHESPFGDYGPYEPNEKE